MAEQHERDGRPTLAWPPDGDDLDIVDLDIDLDGRTEQRSTSPGASLGLAATRHEMAAHRLESLRKRYDRSAPAAPATGETPGWTDREEDDSASVALPAVPEAGAGHREPWRPRIARWAGHRPAWLTVERLAMLVLLLLAVAEGAFIALRTWGTPNATNTPPRAVGTTGITHTNQPAGATRPGSDVNGGPTRTTAATGRLLVRTIPDGGAVKVDGKARGTAPVSVLDLTEGDHTVVVESRLGTVRQQVHVAAAQDVALVVPLAATAPMPPPGLPAAGGLKVDSPVEVRILDGERLLGTSEMDRVPLSPGRHQLAFVNDDVGYRGTQAVLVAAGKTSTVKVDIPKQPIAINAIPWAEVWIDGQRVGETPLGDVPVTPGRHTVVLRHPELGERTLRTTVRVDQPTRLSADLRKQ